MWFQISSTPLGTCRTVRLVLINPGCGAQIREIEGSFRLVPWRAPKICAPTFNSVRKCGLRFFGRESEPQNLTNPPSSAQIPVAPKLPHGVLQRGHAGSARRFSVHLREGVSGLLILCRITLRCLRRKCSVIRKSNRSAPWGPIPPLSDSTTPAGRSGQALPQGRDASRAV